MPALSRKRMNGATSRPNSGGRPPRKGLSSGTERAVSSVSPKPSKSSSSSFRPCHVIAGSTTSGRPPDGPPWTATGTLARSRPALMRSTWRPVSALAGISTRKRRLFREPLRSTLGAPRRLRANR